MKRPHGFTVIELLVVIAFFGVATTLALLQLQGVRAEFSNQQKRTAINAMYFSLEEGFYKQHGYYPERLADNTLPTMDAALLKDPLGHKLGDAKSAYRYDSEHCHDGRCRSYTLRATLSGEDDFVKASRHK